jgi:translocation and assembly module TamB
MSEAPAARSRHRMLRWTVALLAAAVVVAVSAVAWLLGTQAGLNRVSAWMPGLTGGQVELEGAEGRLAGPLSIKQLRVRTETLQLDADMLTLDWSPWSLLRGVLSVDTLELARLRIASAPGDGSSSGPPAGFSLPLEVDAARLHLGELVVAPFPMDAVGGEVVVAPLDLRINTSGNTLHLGITQLRTPWGGGQGEISLGTTAPMALSGTASLDSDIAGPPLSVTLSLGGVVEAMALNAKAEGAGATVQVDGVITPFEALPARTLTVHGEGIDPQRWREGLPSAVLELDAQFTREGDRLSGPVKLLNRAPGTLDAGRLPLASLSSKLRASLDAVSLGQLALDAEKAGRITGSADWAASTPATAELLLAGVDLRAIDTRLPTTALAGPLTLSADDAGQHVKADLKDADILAQVAVHRVADRVSLERVHLQRGKAEALMTGAVDLGGDLPFDATITLRDVDPQALWAEAPAGNVGARLAVKGALSVPAAHGEYRIEHGQLGGQPISGNGAFAWVGERLEKIDARAALGDNQLVAQGAWGGTGDVLNLDLDARQLAQLGAGVGGQLSVKAQLSGTLERPAGRLSATAGKLSLPGQLRLGKASLSAELQDGIDGPMALTLDGEDLHVGANLVSALSLEATGTRRAHVIDARARMAQDTASLQLQGGLNDDAGWRGQLSKLAVDGRYPVRLDAPVDLALAPAAVSVGAGRLALGSRGEAVFEPTQWTPGRLRTRGRVSGLTLGLETRPDAPPKRGSGDLVLGGDWDLDFDRQAKGTVHVFRESGDLVLVGDTVVRFGLERLDLLATVDGQRLALGVDAAGSTLGELTGSATARLKREDGVWQVDETAPLLGSADLNVGSIGWLGSVASPVVRTDGQLKAVFSLSGTPAKPVGTGQINGENLLIEIPTEGLRLSGGTLDARFDAETLDINTLRFVSESRIRPRDSRIPYAELTRTPGTLSAQGSLKLADGEGGLDIEADRLPLFQRPDRWLAISGKGRMDTRWDAPRIDATVTADGGYLEFARTPAPSLSSDVKVLGTDEAAPSGSRQLKARVAIGLGNQLYLSALGLDTRLAGQLLLVADSGEPMRATGTLETVGGTYEGYGQKLVIERGLVNFQGPLDNPGLNVVALRKGLEVEAGVSIGGTVRRPSVKLVSSPDVPDTEKLSWIVLGRAPEGGGSGDLTALIPAAQALLGGPGGGISSQLAAGLGFDELSIGQGELNSVGRVATSSVVGGGSATRGDATVSGQVLSVGKRLSADTTLSFEQSLSGVEHVVKLTHQLTRQLAVIGRAGTDNAIDLRWSLSFR